MSDSILEVRHLSKAFGANVVLRDIDFTVRPGDVTSIIGASGSGKSTLLRCINLLETPTSGEVLFHGTDITARGYDATAYRAKVGMVFQSFNLFNNMTVLENCMVGQIKVLKKNKDEARAQAMNYLEKVGMAPYINARPRQISGGQKQRVAIARMLTKKTPIMVFDDSLSAVDTQTDEKIRTALGRDLAGTTTIIISHRITTLMDCDNVLVLEHGKLLQYGPPQELLRQPGLFRQIYDMQMSIGEEEPA